VGSKHDREPTAPNCQSADPVRIGDFVLLPFRAVAYPISAEAAHGNSGLIGLLVAIGFGALAWSLHRPSFRWRTTPTPA
jgi:hypothetical protein